MSLWPFKKKPEKAKQVNPAAPATSKQAAASSVMAQMRGLRAEIGEENLNRLVSHLKLEDLKNKMRDDIASDPRKRDKLLDELKFQLKDK